MNRKLCLPSQGRDNRNACGFTPLLAHQTGRDFKPMNYLLQTFFSTLLIVPIPAWAAVNVFAIIAEERDAAVLQPHANSSHHEAAVSPCPTAQSCAAAHPQPAAAAGKGPASLTSLTREHNRRANHSFFLLTWSYSVALPSPVVPHSQSHKETPN